MKIVAKPWKKNRLPKRILAIRLQAMGDMVITLPYLQALKNALPADVELDFLTRQEIVAIPQALTLFNNVYAIAGKRDFRKQLVYAILLLPKLCFRRYEMVIDLQNNKISNLVRKVLMPLAWTEFDRFSPNSAGERNRLTIEAIGLKLNFFVEKNTFKQQPMVENILVANGWDKKSGLVLLNPAGAFSSRNWEMDNYAMFAKLWLQKFPNTQFLVLGTSFVAGKARFLKESLHDKLIDLSDKTTAIEAFAILEKAKLVLTEDSGLMHMAWVSNAPTLAIFGSTRSDWAAPIGKHTMLLSSDDLPCGNCMLEICKYGDVHCIKRYTPQFIFEKAIYLLQSLKA